MLDQTPGPDIAGQPAIIQQPVPAPSMAISRILSRFDRTELEGFISIAIDLLDLADGDTDVEDNGDELDGTAGEDDFYPHNSNWRGEPGCPISDPGGGAVDDEAELTNEDGCDPYSRIKPKYGIDQSKGPTNEGEVSRDHFHRLHTDRSYSN